MSISIAENRDCMEALKEFPDGFFDLACVDPPYGGGSQTVNVERESCAEAAQTLSKENGQDSEGGLTATISNKAMDGRFGNKGSRFEKYRQQGGAFSPNEITVERTGGTWATKYEKNISHWDIAPPPEYFKELARVSKNQIIWGGNYFDLPPTRCFLVWRKLTISENFSMAMAEYAWTSFNDNAKVFEAAPQGNTEKRFHPTQKPISLYDWIFRLYAKPGYKILDTHMGSQSSRIAAYNAGLDYWGYEIDETYFRLGCERFEEHTAQQNLFLMEGI